MIDYIVEDLLSGVEGIRSRAMFGGHGIYQDELFFAIVVDDEIYFKVDDTNRPDYEKAESEPFAYEVSGRKKPVVMSYWKVPADILEDRQALAILRSRKRQGGPGGLNLSLWQTVPL
jgi:DNA transformation protein